MSTKANFNFSNVINVIDLPVGPDEDEEAAGAGIEVLPNDNGDGDGKSSSDDNAEKTSAEEVPTTVISSDSDGSLDATEGKTKKCCIIVGGLASLIGVAGVASFHLAGAGYNMVNISSRKQASVVGVGVGGVNVNNDNIRVRGYDYVGVGHCVDAGGNNYDHIEYLNVESVKKCAKICSQCPGGVQARQLHGFEYSLTYQDCLCRVENVDTFELLRSICESKDYHNSYNVGTGEIVGSDPCDPNPNDGCWRKASYTCWKSKSRKGPRGG